MDEQLLGLAEIAELYGVDKSTANNWSRSRDFPEPRWRLKMGPIWTLNQLERWRVPARMVDGDYPPAPILEVTIGAQRSSGLEAGVTVRCPLCPKKHFHSFGLGHRVPHCLIPTFSAGYIITDPDDRLTEAAKKHPELQSRLPKSKEDL